MTIDQVYAVVSELQGAVAAIQIQAQVNTEILERVEAHVKETNGWLGEVEAQAATRDVSMAKIEGAVSLGRWMLAATLMIVAAGAAVAGVIVAVVA